jgi:hypothetical protein
MSSAERKGALRLKAARSRLRTRLVGRSLDATGSLQGERKAKKPMTTRFFESGDFRDGPDNCQRENSIPPGGKANWLFHKT